MGADLHQTVDERLAAADQRYTASRRMIVQALLDSDRPLTIPELLERCPTLRQSSAYRNLAVLEELGVVRRIVASGEFACFELDEELTEHHHHLICSLCGSVEDFVLPADVERTVDRALQRATRGTGFRGVHHRLDLVGVCAKCA